MQITFPIVEVKTIPDPDQCSTDVLKGGRLRVDIGKHGFVEMVDVSPRLVPEGRTPDFAVIRAARTSTDTALKEIKDDDKLLRYLFRHRHCYDRETEVLCRYKGHTGPLFMSWVDAYNNRSQGLEVGVWDPNAQTLRYEVPKSWHRSHYKGEMYCVSHGGVSLRVTPEHKLWVKYGQGGKTMDEFQLIPASEVGMRSMVRYSKLAPYRGTEMSAPLFSSYEPTTEKHPHSIPYDDFDALLQFCGFFIGDGSVHGTARNQVGFHLKKPRKMSYLLNLVERLGWECKVTDGWRGAKRFHVTAPNISAFFRHEFFTTTTEKNLPDWILDLNERQANLVLDGLRNSDGTSKRSAWVYNTGVSVLADQIQILGLHGGHACHVNSPTSSGCYRVMFLSRMDEPVVNQGTQNVFPSDYDDFVYCAETSTGVLVVRREGKIVLCGNSTPFEFVEFTWLMQLPIFVARQMIRHRTSSVNEVSARYVELPDMFFEPESDQVRLQGISNKQGGNEIASPGVANQFLSDLEESNRLSRQVYEQANALGVSRELSRLVLPVNAMTRWMWKANLHNTLHLLSLRMDSHAQKEIRDYADAMYAMLKRVVPRTIDAFDDYHPARGGMLLSRMEIEALNGNSPPNLTGRELEEFKEKLKVLKFSE